MTETNTTITANETQLLTAIRDSEYHDGRDPIGDPIWVDCACEGFGRSAGGIMASLVRKGLADTDGECCWITEEGMAALAPAEEPATEEPASSTPVPFAQVVLPAAGGYDPALSAEVNRALEDAGKAWTRAWACATIAGAGVGSLATALTYLGQMRVHLDASTDLNGHRATDRGLELLRSAGALERVIVAQLELR